MTSMVGEFPELQGIMGGHYLRLEGSPEDLWTAARDHYRPVGFDGDLPVSVDVYPNVYFIIKGEAPAPPARMVSMLFSSFPRPTIPVI